ncbi:MAG: alpha-amylase family glycosyl hydrolase [Akkermansiaceae bacterium]|jgi:glycosidase|nr:alpha-amylase family glycosyl hydrolase [Akkermansiaceae bacterium]
MDRNRTFANVRNICLTALFLLAIAPLVPARPWSEDVMYFMMTDRFHDGDPSNNQPAGVDAALYDPHQQDISRYMGGDLRGVEKAIQSGYFNDMGITALWLTPVVKNVWRSGYDLGGWKTGYHGYWTQDWLDIDPHLTSSVSLNGETYANDAEGRMKHYRDLVKLAHSKGIKIIQDVVLNHAGPVFYYDVNDDNVFDVSRKDEWVQPFMRDGFHASAKWADVPKWNAARTQPDGPRTLLGREIKTRGVLAQIEAYGRKGFSHDSLGKSDGEEVMCDFFSLRDLWTAPDGQYFDKLVDEFVEIYHFYLTTVGVDGLRVDTVKHVHHEFWDAFTERLRKRLGSAAADKLLFGEIYDGSPATLGRYTWRSDWPKSTEPGLDGVLDFNFCFNAREYLRQPGAKYGSPAALEKSLATRTAVDSNNRPYYNPNPGPDGLNSRQKMITFIENHDGLNRFRVAGVTERRNRLAQGLVMTLPGIPCLYYGTEFALLDESGKIGEDGETGRQMFFSRKNGPTMDEVKKSASFQEIGALAALREKFPVLRSGDVVPLWVDSGAGPQDDGVFVFGRASGDGSSFVVVVVNASDESRTTGVEGQPMRLPSSLQTAGKVLRPVLTIGSGKQAEDVSIPADGPLMLPVPHSSLVVYEAVPATSE